MIAVHYLQHEEWHPVCTQAQNVLLCGATGAPLSKYMGMGTCHVLLLHPDPFSLIKFDAEWMPVDLIYGR